MVLFEVVQTFDLAKTLIVFAEREMGLWLLLLGVKLPRLRERLWVH